MYSAHCNTAKASATLKFWSTASTRDSPPPRRSGALTSALLSDLGVSALSILLAARLSAAPDTPLPTNGEASLRSPLQTLISYLWPECVMRAMKSRRLSATVALAYSARSAGLHLAIVVLIAAAHLSMLSASG